MNLNDTIKKINARINRTAFILNANRKAILSPKPGIKILFSRRDEWEKNIRGGFALSPHKLIFKELADQNISEYDLVVPLTVADIRYLNEQRAAINGNQIPIPTLESVDICEDKLLFDQKLRENGFGNYLPKIDRGLPYPYILKKRVAENSDFCFIISDLDAETKYKHLIESPEYFCQQIIVGSTEFATHLILKAGEIKSSLTIKYAFDGANAIKGKSHEVYRKTAGCPYLALFAEILKSINFEGLCCFNYKIVDGKPLIFEVNPRFGGSLCTFFFAFVNAIN
jgi:hypothetical protein